MQNSSYNRPGTSTSWQWINGVLSAGYPVNTEYPATHQSSFTFSGFGPNPDPRKVLPVAGSYTKTYWKAPHGSDRTLHMNTNQLNLTEGYMGGSYGDHISTYGYDSVTTANIASDSYMNWVYNECLDKFYEKIKQSETNIALTLGEGRETGRMFKVFRSVDKVVKAIRTARKLIKRNPSLLLAQTHLSIKYGWMPLFNDIWNYADWTYKQFSVGIPIKARRRKVVKVWDTSPSSGDWARVIKGERVYSCEIGVTCYVDDPDWFTVSRLTSLNPAAIAWELTTLSFVVDWLWDVGSYLENLENSLGVGLAFRHGYVTRVYRHNLSEQQSTSWYSPLFNRRGETFLESVSQRAVKQRNVLTTFPRPLKPTFKLRMGSGRILSAAALSRTILLGKVR